MMTEKESFIQKNDDIYDDYIQLKKDNIFKVGIKDSQGKDTGKYLSFDLEDITLPLKLSDCENMHHKNVINLRDRFTIIDKKEDVKGKKMLSKNQEEKIKVLDEFYHNEMKALDLFIGEGKTQMILDIKKRKPYYSMYEDINELLEPILPKLKMNVDSIKKQIMDKYSVNKESNVLK